jgi:hypothetical protein
MISLNDITCQAIQAEKVYSYKDDFCFYTYEGKRPRQIKQRF